MKRLTIAALMALVSLLGFAQDDVNYSMIIHLTDGTTLSCKIAEVDSIVYREISEDASNDDDSSDDISEDASNSDDSSDYNGHEYVDLGLSVKWATCNIGASSPEDYGNYYAWGETKTKSTYSTSTSVTYGVEMDDISGNATYDAATANWGGTWRMPTYNEMGELMRNCTWTWTTQNNVTGYLVTGTNGNSIFLPAAGDCSEATIPSSGGYYWSSMPDDTGNIYRAYNLFFYNGYYALALQSRVIGCPVRAVSN